MIFSVLVWVLGRVPLRVIAVFCWLFSWFWWVALPVRRGVALENFRRAFPRVAAGPSLRRMTYGLFLGYAEVVRLERNPDTALDVVQMRGLELLQERAQAGQGTIVAAGHFGSFDCCLMAFGKAPGLDVSCIVRAPTQPEVAAFIERARLACSVDLIPPTDSSDEIDRRLADGGTVTFVVDQRHRAGLRVPFFGQPALTAPSAVAFARRLRVPIVPAVQWRVGVNRHVLRLFPPLEITWTEDREADLVRGLAALHAVFEEHIRAHPEGWLWWHRRWAN